MTTGGKRGIDRKGKSRACLRETVILSYPRGRAGARRCRCHPTYHSHAAIPAPQQRPQARTLPGHTPPGADLTGLCLSLSVSLDPTTGQQAHPSRIMAPNYLITAQPASLSLSLLPLGPSHDHCRSARPSLPHRHPSEMCLLYEAYPSLILQASLSLPSSC